MAALNSLQIFSSLFSSVKVFSTVDGATYSKVEGRLTSKSPLNGFTSRVIYIPLRHRLAVALRVEFEMGKGRFLVSEVRFSNSKWRSRFSGSLQVLLCFLFCYIFILLSRESGSSTTASWFRSCWPSVYHSKMGESR